jgi:hypothetical protein
MMRIQPDPDPQQCFFASACCSAIGVKLILNILRVFHFQNSMNNFPSAKVGIPEEAWSSAKQPTALAFALRPLQ